MSKRTSAERKETCCASVFSEYVSLALPKQNIPRGQTFGLATIVSTTEFQPFAS